jgi:hypothetical protein
MAMHKRTKLTIILALFILIIQTFNITVLAAKNLNGKDNQGKGQSDGESNTSNFGIYADNQCTDTLSFIDWGTLNPGTNKNMVCFIKNEGSKPLLLSLKTSNWSPKTAFKDISVIWDYDGAPINPGEAIPVSLTLSTAHETDFTDLSVDITIVGSI